jgi:hypothetical protein
VVLQFAIFQRTITGTYEQIQIPAQPSYMYAFIEVFLQGACWELDTEIWRSPLKTLLRSFARPGKGCYKVININHP